MNTRTTLGIALLSMALFIQSCGAGPSDVAKTFIEVRDQADADAAAALFVEEPAIDHLVGTVEEYRAWLERQLAVDHRETVTDCSESPTGADVVAFCSYIFDNAWSRARGVDPFTGSSYRLRIVDGQIAEMRWAVELDEFSVEAWDLFRAWIIANHPDDEDAMYVDGAIEMPNLAPESLALWELYSNEFAATMNES